MLNVQVMISWFDAVLNLVKFLSVLYKTVAVDVYFALFGALIIEIY